MFPTENSRDRIVKTVLSAELPSFGCVQALDLLDFPSADREGQLLLGDLKSPRRDSLARKRTPRRPALAAGGF